MKEIWKQIPSYEGYYEVSNNGEVRRMEMIVVQKNGKKYVWKSKILKQVNVKGYKKLSLCKNGEIKQRTVHRLVMTAFVPNTENKPQINPIHDLCLPLQTA